MVPYNSKSDLPLRCPLQKQVSFAGCLIGLDVPEKTDDLMAFKKSIDFKNTLCTYVCLYYVRKEKEKNIFSHLYLIYLHTFCFLNRG